MKFSMTMRFLMWTLWFFTLVVAVLAVIFTPWLFFPAGILLLCAAIVTGVYYTDPYYNQK